MNPVVKRPAKELRGFERVSLNPGQSRTITFELPKEKLSFYDEKVHAFVVNPGAFEVMVGAASDDIRLTNQVTVRSRFSACCRASAPASPQQTPRPINYNYGENYPHDMAAKTDPQLDVNSWLQEELREQYHHDHSSIDEEWKHLFDANGAPKSPDTGSATSNVISSVTNGATKPALSAPVDPAEPYPPALLEPTASEELQPLRGAAGAIAKNMNASVSIPLATSQRIIPVKVIEENRQLINHHRGLLGKGKISYTHIIGWAVIKAVQANPALNHAFTDNNGEPFRVLRHEINLGIAVDVAAKGGGRSLMVPNIKNAGSLEVPSTPPPSTTSSAAPAPANSPPPISRALPFPSPIPVPSAPWHPCRA